MYFVPWIFWIIFMPCLKPLLSVYNLFQYLVYNLDLTLLLLLKYLKNDFFK